MLRATPAPSTTSALEISSAAVGDAKPPEIPSDHGFPANNPLATAEVASNPPSLSASDSSGARADASRAPRPAIINGLRARSSASAASEMADGDGHAGRSNGGSAAGGSGAGHSAA